MTCSSLARPLQSGELYHALFMLHYAFFNKYDENSMEIIWTENPAIKICE
jgi:hypothetical protein